MIKGMSRAGGAGRVDNGEMAIASIASVQCSSAERSNAGENSGGPRVVPKRAFQSQCLGAIWNMFRPKMSKNMMIVIAELLLFSEVSFLHTVANVAAPY